MEQNTKQIRELTKEIRIGDRVIGGSYPILIQSMTCLLYTSDAADD